MDFYSGLSFKNSTRSTRLVIRPIRTVAEDFSATTARPLRSDRIVGARDGTRQSVMQPAL